MHARIDKAKKDQKILLQPKLTIGASNDEYEREADYVAEQIMRMPDSSIKKSSCTCGQNSFDICEACSNKQELIQPKSSTPTSTIEAPPIVSEVLNSPGQPLDYPTRQYMEPRFGHDFRHVRVRADDRAEESAQEVNARAYAVGNNIVFGAAQYVPSSYKGKKLMAHELAHVIQQLGASRLRFGRGSSKRDLSSNSIPQLTIGQANSKYRLQRQERRSQLDSYDHFYDLLGQGAISEALDLINGQSMDVILDWLTRIQFRLDVRGISKLASELGWERMSVVADVVEYGTLSPSAVDYSIEESLRRRSRNLPGDQQILLQNYVRTYYHSSRFKDYLIHLLTFAGSPYFWQVRSSFFGIVQIKQLGPASDDDEAKALIDIALFQAAGDNLTLLESYYRTYSTDWHIEVVQTDSAAQTIKRSNQRTEVNPSILSYPPLRLGTTLFHELLHASDTPVTTSLSQNPQEGYTYGIEFFMARRSADAKWEKDISDYFATYPFLDPEGTAKHFIEAYGTLTILYDVIDGRKAITVPPGCPMPPNRPIAQQLVTEYVARRPSDLLNSISSFVLNNESVFSVHVPASVRAKL